MALRTARLNYRYDSAYRYYRYYKYYSTYNFIRERGGSEEQVGLGEGVGLADVDEVEVTAAVSFDATYANW